MPAPVEFTIAAHAGGWELSRDGRRTATFSHLEQATHEAVRHARALEESGQPARVLIHAAEGKVIEVEVTAEVTREDERAGPELARS